MLPCHWAFRGLIAFHFGANFPSQSLDKYWERAFMGNYSVLIEVSADGILDHVLPVWHNSGTDHLEVVENNCELQFSVTVNSILVTLGISLSIDSILDYGCSVLDVHSIWNGVSVELGEEEKENSPDRGLRSSPHLDPDLGWPWKSYRREYLTDL